MPRYDPVGGPDHAPPSNRHRPFLFTDIEASTTMLRSLGERYSEVLDAYRTLIRTAIADHGGHDLGTEGDSFFVAFESVGNALSAAVEAQRSLFTHPWSHEGEPSEQQEIDDALRLILGLQ